MRGWSCYSRKDQVSPIEILLIGLDHRMKLKLMSSMFPELNLSAKVNQAGYLSLPLLGGVRAIGQTEPELQALLKEKLHSYLKSPEVSVAIKKYASQRVSVVGAVSKPGSFALEQGGQTIQEVINLAGGVSKQG